MRLTGHPLLLGCVLAAGALLPSCGPEGPAEGPAEVAEGQAEGQETSSASDRSGQPVAIDVADVLRQASGAVGAEQLHQGTGEFRLRWEATRGDARFEVTVRLRLDPFAVREEWSRGSAALLASSPPDVRVCNGVRAWRLTEDGSEPLLGSEAIEMLERALMWELLFSPEHFTDAARARTVGELYALPGESDDFGAGRNYAGLRVSSAAGSQWDALFDRENGRLLALYCAWEPGGGQWRWRRFGEWITDGDLRLPGRWIEGVDETPGASVGLEILARQELDETLWDLDPAASPGRLLDAAPLLLAPRSLPGSFALGLGELWLDGKGPFHGLLDTGATRPVVHAPSVPRLELQRVGDTTVGALHGRIEVPILFLDSLRIGAYRRLQVPVLAASLPGVPDAPFDIPGVPLALIGGPLLLEAAPIFDFERGRLRFRGRPVMALDELRDVLGEGTPRPPADAPGIPAVPIRFNEKGADMTVQVVVDGHPLEVLVDTGLIGVLRLHPRGLRACGLPTDAEAWRLRGAMAYRIRGAGAQFRDQLVARLDQVSLGSVVFLRPWVHLALTEEDDPGAATARYDGLLGAGALAVFGKVGIDPQRSRLELEPRPGSPRRTNDGQWLVPEPGEYLGFALDPPGVRDGSGRPALPAVVEITPGGPADRGGLAVGDLLLAVDGLGCQGISPQVLWPRLWPPTGERVRLHVVRPGLAPAPDSVLEVWLP